MEIHFLPTSLKKICSLCHQIIASGILYKETGNDVLSRCRKDFFQIKIRVKQ